MSPGKRNVHPMVSSTVIVQLSAFGPYGNPVGSVVVLYASWGGILFVDRAASSRR